VYFVKLNFDGSLHHYKAQLVVLGNNQKYEKLIKIRHLLDRTLTTKPKLIVNSQDTTLST